VYKVHFITCFKANPDGEKLGLRETRIYHCIQDTFSIVMTISPRVITDIPDDIRLFFLCLIIYHMLQFHSWYLFDRSLFASDAL